MLMKTGASEYLNEIDPTDGLRPIDAATQIPALVLTGCAECHLNPRNGYSVLHRMIRYFHTEDLILIIDRIDRDLLDWVDPRLAIPPPFCFAARRVRLNCRTCCHWLDRSIRIRSDYAICRASGRT